MRPAIAALVIGALSVSAQVSVHVQTVPSARPPQTEQSVTVEGCVHGKRFRPDLSMANTKLIFDELDVKEFQLEGPEGLMKILKEHNTHQDEITGVVLVPNNRATRVKTAQVGKRTRVTTTSSGPGQDPRAAAPGAGRLPAAGDTRERSTNTQPSPQYLRMKVTSLRHLDNKCQPGPVSPGPTRELPQDQ
jgi:hypothetical protein